MVKQADSIEQSEAVGADQQVVVFDLGEELFGIDIARVQEIIRWQRITRMPNSPHFVEGVIDLRGRVIPIVDLRRRFGRDSTEPTKETRVVVVEIDTLTVGLIVDAVSEVLHVPMALVEPPSPLVTTTESTYLRGIARMEDKLISLLDLEWVISLESIR